MTSHLQEKIKKKKNSPKTTISKLNLHTNNNKDWSGSSISKIDLNIVLKMNIKNANICR